jgi:hypothetical protein
MKHIPRQACYIQPSHAWVQGDQKTVAWFAELHKQTRTSDLQAELFIIHTLDEELQAELFIIHTLDEELQNFCGTTLTDS